MYGEDILIKRENIIEVIDMIDYTLVCVADYDKSIKYFKCKRAKNIYYTRFNGVTYAVLKLKGD